MPDHLHLIVSGLTNGSDFLKFMKLAKQLSGYHVKRQFAFSLWEDGYHDRIIREDEDLLGYLRYVALNPVCAKLVAHPADYPFLWIAEPYRAIVFAQLPHP